MKGFSLYFSLSHASLFLSSLFFPTPSPHGYYTWTTPGRSSVFIPFAVGCLIGWLLVSVFFDSTLLGASLSVGSWSGCRPF